MGVIIFNGQSSSDYGIRVETPPDYEVPQRDYDVTHVPGRNGDVYIDKGSYQNVSRSYDISAARPHASFSEIASGITQWLHSTNTYARLEDSYEPDYYRMAMFSGEDDLTIENIFGIAGKATISFDCKPQRFLRSGERAITLSGTTVLLNPTYFTALPVITVTGSGAGVLRVGDYVVTIAGISSSITIDSDVCDVYNGTVNMNSYVAMDNGFPKLTAGANEISFSGAITSVEVVPNWWTL